MDQARLERLRSDVQAWERATFGPAPGGAAATRGLHTTAAATPPAYPKMDIPTWAGAMEVRTAVSPDCSYRLLAGALGSAKTSLDVYIYDITSDHVVDVLRKRLAEGVKVRLMYDTTDGTAARTEVAELATLKGATIQTAPSSGSRRIFTVCHQKYAVIDGKEVVLGSANWAETSIPFVTTAGQFKKGNREWLVHLKNKDAAAWFGKLFQADWDIPARRDMLKEAEARTMPPAVAVSSKATNPPGPYDIKDFQETGAGAAKASIQPVISPQNYFESIRDLIRSAGKSVDIQQQYILAGGNNIEALLKELQQCAAKPGMVVRIMVSPAFPQNWQRSVETLDVFGLKGHLKALNLDHYIHLHNKGLIIDGKKVVVSSTNWSENSISLAREAGVVIESTEISQYYQTVFDADWGRGWDLAAVKENVARVTRGGSGAGGEGFTTILPGELV
jgi:phosphatidylserine/phosphatidylglycerophosphate/cardiolipin synthase-like enzyme